jgi:hypothetical protein
MGICLGVTGLSLFSLKGCNNIAQGNALGKGVKESCVALNGRNNWPINAFVAPFQGFASMWSAIPRALPWAILLQPCRLNCGIPVSPT